MRIALGVEYNGHRYFGWQRQREVLGVQQDLEAAIAKVTNHDIEVTCAGRTDAGVHATAQVVHFDTAVERRAAAWTLGLNSNLPDSIAIRWAKKVDDEFHARFSATARRYRYVIYNHRLRPAILRHGVSHYHGSLDHVAMNNAGQVLLGEHDFSTFRAVQCQSRTPWRNVSEVSVNRLGDYVVLDIKANAFVHHMVRNIAGSLILVGQGIRPENWIKDLLVAKDRTLAGATAKAQGLYLVGVDYPKQWQIPRVSPGPLFLSERLN